jgi:phosphopantothenoylcysteine decarboxylase/phosphopantothenate--cysteine ligase
MFAAMRCLVTAGPTYEPLDKVRRLTNFSTGRLGSELGAFLVAKGHEVALLLGEQATYAGRRNADRVETFTTTANLREQLCGWRDKNVDAIFHAAAVSDFAFGKVWLRSPDGELTEVNSGKLSTRQGTLLAELIPAPKIIAELRDWFPRARLIGWKFDVEGKRESVIEAAEKQIAECRADACVANGPAYGDGFGLVRNGAKHQHLPNKSALFEELERFLCTEH